MNPSDAPIPIPTRLSRLIDDLDAGGVNPSIPPALRSAESVVRNGCVDVAALWPATQGLRPQIVLLVGRAAALVEGPTSRLTRSLRAKKPELLQLDAGPLAGALRACADYGMRAREMCAAARLAASIGETFNHLEREFSIDVPRAWRYWTEGHGVDRQAISMAQSIEQLEHIARWLGQIENELTIWRSDILRWLADSPADEEASLPLATLEHRYEILIAVGVADRRPSQRASAAQVRRNVGEHLRHLAAHAVIGRDDGMLRIAEDYAEGQHESSMTSDEIGTYMLALDYYSSSRNRSRPFGSDE